VKTFGATAVAALTTRPLNDLRAGLPIVTCRWQWNWTGRSPSKDATTFLVEIDDAVNWEEAINNYTVQQKQFQQGFRIVIVDVFDRDFWERRLN
jgi:hypothetical protein